MLILYFLIALGVGIYFTLETIEENAQVTVSDAMLILLASVIWPVIAIALVGNYIEANFDGDKVLWKKDNKKK